MCYPIYAQKGNTALLGRPAKDINPIPCSSAVATASAEASRSPPAFGVLSHRDKDCQASLWMPVSICCSWHRASDRRSCTGCGCNGILGFGCRVGVGTGSFLVVEVASAGPWGAAWCPAMIRILWECISEGFVMLLWMGSSPAPCTTEQHCYIHGMDAHTPHKGSVQQFRLAWIPLGFQYPIPSSLVLWGLLLRRT